MMLTHNEQEVEKMFRYAVFNVLSHNRDDHSKNFSFLMNSDGVWSVAPAYDLTFSSGPGGEHCTTVLGEGRNPTLKHLTALAAKFLFTEKKVSLILEQTKEAIASWPKIAKSVGVSGSTIKQISSYLK